MKRPRAAPDFPRRCQAPGTAHEAIRAVQRIANRFRITLSEQKTLSQSTNRNNT
jgi:hypothetical protein